MQEGCEYEKEEDAALHKPSKLKGLVWIAAACLFAVLLAGGVAPLAHAIPWHWEQSLARALPSQVGQSCHPDRMQRQALQQLLRRLYPIEPGDKKFSIQVRIVKNPVVNAYATLGGNIYVDSALLAHARTPEELAGVLAHEIGHVSNRHIMQGFIVDLFTSAGLRMVFSSGSDENVTDLFLRMTFSRGEESQADAAGLHRLQIAHINNAGFKNFFERLGKSGLADKFLSNHPANQARIDMVNDYDNTDTRPAMSEAEWKILKGYCKRR